MIALLVIAVVLNVLLLLGITMGVALIWRRLDRAATDMSAKLSETQQELHRTLRSAQDALRGVESLAGTAEAEMARVDSVLRAVENIVSGSLVAEAAVRAVRGGQTTITSVLAGLREGLRALRSRQPQQKEDQANG